MLIGGYAINRDTLKQIMIVQKDIYLNTTLEIGLELSGIENKPYLFLDEIQNIDGWEKFVRRIADMKYKVSITGSNHKMLSSEMAFGPEYAQIIGRLLPSHHNTGSLLYCSANRLISSCTSFTRLFGPIIFAPSPSAITQ